MNKIQELRKALGWSQAELARRASLNATTVGLFENGRLRPYQSQVEKLAKALGMPSNDLSNEEMNTKAAPEKLGSGRDLEP